MKRGALIVSVLLIIMLSLSLVSASWFSDAWDKITGQATGTPSGIGGGGAVAPIRTCADSDNTAVKPVDDDPSKYIQGKVTYTYKGRIKEYSDKCLWGGKRVKEYYCDPKNKVKSRTLKCGEGCADGKCTTEAYVTINSAIIKGDIIEIKYSKNFDTCAHIYTSTGEFNQIINFICEKGENKLAIADMNNFSRKLVVGEEKIKLCHGNDVEICSEFVELGEVLNCTDSDGGLNYYVKGDTKGINAKGTDFCGIRTVPEFSELILVNSCEKMDWESGKQCTLYEWACGGSPDLNESNAIQWEYECPNGCEDGACAGNENGSISFTKIPSNGSIISGSVEISIYADSPGGIERSHIYINKGSSGRSYKTCFGTNECTYIWDTTEFENGEYYIFANARDKVDLKWVNTEIVYITIKNPSTNKYVIELTAATDNSATIKVTDSNGISDIKEIVEADSKIVNGIEVFVLEADESTATNRISAKLKIDGMYLEVS